MFRYMHFSFVLCTRNTVSFAGQSILGCSAIRSLGVESVLLSLQATYPRLSTNSLLANKSVLQSRNEHRLTSNYPTLDHRSCLRSSSSMIFNIQLTMYANEKMNYKEIQSHAWSLVEKLNFSWSLLFLCVNVFLVSLVFSVQSNITSPSFYLLSVSHNRLNCIGFLCWLIVEPFHPNSP